MFNFHRFIRPLERDASYDVFRTVPLHARGKLFVSPMPFGAYDKGNRLIRLYGHSHIRRVFVLAQEEEIRKKAKRDLFDEYARIGAGVSHFPFIDMQAPDIEAMHRLVAEVREHVSRRNVAIHCHAGVGRTSVAVCCVVQAELDMAPDESIAYVSRYMEVNMTSEQKVLVRKFEGATHHA